MKLANDCRCVVMARAAGKLDLGLTIHFVSQLVAQNQGMSRESWSDSASDKFTIHGKVRNVNYAGYKSSLMVMESDLVPKNSMDKTVRIC